LGALGKTANAELEAPWDGRELAAPEEITDAELNPLEGVTGFGLELPLGT